MKKIFLMTAASLLTLSASAFADDLDPQNRLGWDNVDYFKQSGQLSPTYAPSSPPDPEYMQTAQPEQRLSDKNYQYFDPQGQREIKPGS
jgi:hypothetical protein